MTTGVILIERIEVFAYHGCYEVEQALGQRYSLDIRLTADLEPAARSDDLKDAIDYAGVTMLALETFRANRFNLLEAAASKVIDTVLEAFPTVEAMEITVRKLSPPIAAPLAAVGVMMERRRGG